MSEQDIKDIYKDYVQKDTFRWTVGIVVTVMIVIIGYLSSSVSSANDDIRALRTELGVYKDDQYALILNISKDVSFIKAKISGAEITQ